MHGQFTSSSVLWQAVCFWWGLWRSWWHFVVIASKIAMDTSIPQCKVKVEKRNESRRVRRDLNLSAYWYLKLDKPYQVGCWLNFSLQWHKLKSVPQNSNQYWKIETLETLYMYYIYICTALTALPQIMIYISSSSSMAGKTICFVLVSFYYYYYYYYISYISWFTSVLRFCFINCHLVHVIHVMNVINSLFQCNNLI